MVDAWLLSHVRVTRLRPRLGFILQRKSITGGVTLWPLADIDVPPCPGRILDIEEERRGDWNHAFNVLLSKLRPEVLRVLESPQFGFLDMTDVELDYEGLHTLVIFQRAREKARHPIDGHNYLPVRKFVVNVNRNVRTWNDRHLYSWEVESELEAEPETWWYFADGVREVVLVFPRHEFGVFVPFENDGPSDCLLLEPFMTSLIQPSIRYTIVGVDEVHPRWTDAEFPWWEEGRGEGEGNAGDAAHDDDRDDRENEDDSGDGGNSTGVSSRTRRFPMTPWLRQRNVELATAFVERFRQSRQEVGRPTGEFEFLSMDEYRARVGEEVFAYETVI